MDIQALAAQKGLSVQQVGRLKTELEKLGFVVDGAALGEAAQIIVDHRLSPKQAAAKYSEQSVKEVNQSPEGRSNSQFGIFEGLAGIQNVVYQQNQQAYRDAVDSGHAKALGEAFLAGATGEFLFDPASRTGQVLKAVARFDIGRVEDAEPFNFAELALREEGRRTLPFFSAPLLTASKEPDQTSDQLVAAPSAESPQAVEA